MGLIQDGHEHYKVFKEETPLIDGAHIHGKKIKDNYGMQGLKLEE